MQYVLTYFNVKCHLIHRRINSWFFNCIKIVSLFILAICYIIKKTASRSAKDGLLDFNFDCSWKLNGRLYRVVSVKPIAQEVIIKLYLPNGTNRTNFHIFSKVLLISWSPKHGNFEKIKPLLHIFSPIPFIWAIIKKKKSD